MTNTNTSEIKELSRQIEEMIMKLEKGELIIKVRKNQGLDYSEQEDKWICYLRELEKLFDKRRELEHAG